MCLSLAMGNVSVDASENTPSGFYCVFGCHFQYLRISELLHAQDVRGCIRTRQPCFQGGPHRGQHPVRVGGADVSGDLAALLGPRVPHGAIPFHTVLVTAFFNAPSLDGIEVFLAFSL